jgi:hypothetical protein
MEQTIKKKKKKKKKERKKERKIAACDPDLAVAAAVFSEEGILKLSAGVVTIYRSSDMFVRSPRSLSIGLFTAPRTVWVFFHTFLTACRCSMYVI